MSKCEEIFADLMQGLSEAQDKKEEVEKLKPEVDETLAALQKTAKKVRKKCAATSLNKPPVKTAKSIFGCSKQLLQFVEDSSAHVNVLANYRIQLKILEEMRKNNHANLNKVCYCLAAGYLALEFGQEFDSLEAELEALEDELETAEEADNIEQVDEILENIDEVLDDLQFYDELLDELFKEQEENFGD